MRRHGQRGRTQFYRPPMTCRRQERWRSRCVLHPGIFPTQPRSCPGCRRVLHRPDRHSRALDVRLCACSSWPWSCSDGVETRAARIERATALLTPGLNQSVWNIRTDETALAGCRDHHVLRGAAQVALTLGTLRPGVAPSPAHVVWTIGTPINAVQAPSVPRCHAWPGRVAWRRIWVRARQFLGGVPARPISTEGAVR